MKKIIILICLIGFQSLLAQEGELSVFNNLVGSSWISDGKQLGGHDGKTVKEISWGLDGNIVKVITYTTDPETLEFGLRNEGVRIFNYETNQLEFYEFDKFGGISQGVVRVEGQDIHYEYVYEDLLIRDSLIYISDDKYAFKVCSISAEGACLQVYFETTFTRQKK